LWFALLKNRNWLREQDLNLRPFADNKSEPKGDCVFDVFDVIDVIDVIDVFKESGLVAGAGFEPTTFGL
jgi:hypothetical protein